MNFDEAMRWSTLVVAGVAAGFSLLSVYRQRLTQFEVEELKDALSQAAVVRQKQMALREELLGVLDELHGAEARREASILKEPHAMDVEAEAVKIQTVSYRLNDWYRRNEIFLPQSSGLPTILAGLLTLVEGISFDAQTQGPPMDWSQVKPLEDSLMQFVQAALDEVNLPLRAVFSPYLDAVHARSKPRFWSAVLGIGEK